MATTKRRIHIHYVSLAWQEGTTNNKEDMAVAARTGADVIGFDELQGGYRTYMKTVAQQHGYNAVWWGDGEEGFLIKKSYPIISRGRVKVTNRMHLSPARYINWVCINYHGQRLWMHVAHWIVFVAQQGHVTGSPSRTRAHTKITDAMIYQVHRHGTGNDLAFFMGDTNVDERADNHINDHRLVNYRFNRAGLRTVWDEMRVTPSGHSERLDMIGSYDPKKRTKAVRYKVWAKQNSDHRPMSAWYDIDMKKTSSSGTGSATSGGKPATTSKSYKWWDNSDYDDDTIYEISTALDDSGEVEELSG